MGTAGALALMILTPLASGILIGFIQLAAYRLLRRSAEQTPSFPILFARGLLIFFVVAVGLALAMRALPS